MLIQECLERLIIQGSIREHLILVEGSVARQLVTRPPSHPFPATPSGVVHPLVSFMYISDPLTPR